MFVQAKCLFIKDKKFCARTNPLAPPPTHRSNDALGVSLSTTNPNNSLKPDWQIKRERAQAKLNAQRLEKEREEKIKLHAAEEAARKLKLAALRMQYSKKVTFTKAGIGGTAVTRTSAFDGTLPPCDLFSPSKSKKSGGAPASKSVDHSTKSGDDVRVAAAAVAAAITGGDTNDEEVSDLDISPAASPSPLGADDFGEAVSELVDNMASLDEKNKAVVKEKLLDMRQMRVGGEQTSAEQKGEFERKREKQAAARARAKSSRRSSSGSRSRRDFKRSSRSVGNDGDGDGDGDGPKHRTFDDKDLEEGEEPTHVQQEDAPQDDGPKCWEGPQRTDESPKRWEGPQSGGGEGEGGGNGNGRGQTWEGGWVEPETPLRGSSANS